MSKKPASTLAIRLGVLGPSSLGSDGRPAELFTSRRPLRMLAYLFLHRRNPVVRDSAAAALWPDDDPEAARGNLRRHLYLLGKALPASAPGIPWILSGTDRVQLNPDAHIVVDADEFERLAAAGSHELAVERYAGDLFESLDDDWVSGERERLRSLYLSCLGDLVLYHRRRRDVANAALYAQRLLSADPWREDVLRQLMSVRFEAGDAASAIAEYEAFARKLRAELGVEPMQETQSLRETIVLGRAHAIVHHNLPGYLTPIIGREAEIGAVKTLLNESRLVSIVGAGGIGKTRVAVAIAASLLEARPDGVWFVDLAPVTDADLIAVTIAAAMNLLLPLDREPVGALAALLKPLHALIVLDNCEHLIDGVVRLAEALIASSPGVGMLATSRAPLGIPGESVFRLDTLDEETAVALFAARAQQAYRRVLSDRARPVVTEICRRLDGIALAIELAAARAYSMPLQQLLERLDTRLQLLGGGSRTALPRHQTMRALIDWSYTLLSDEERALFRRLAVFSGGFTLEAAIWGAGDDAQEADSQQRSRLVADRLFALIDKSMVDAGESERYGLLDSARAYALERLEIAGEAQDARRAHARYFAQYARSSAEGFGVDAYEKWYGRFSAEIGNFRTALDWAIETEAETAARIIGGLIDYWVYSGLQDEGLKRADAALAALGARSGEADALPVWVAIARLTLWQPFSEAGRNRCIEAGERGLEIAERVGDDVARGHLLRDTATARHDLASDPPRSLNDMQKAGELFQANGKTLYSALAISTYGTFVALTDPERGRRLQTTQTEVARSTGWLLTAARMERGLAQTEFDCGLVEKAIESTKRTVDVFRDYKLPLDLGISLIYLSSYLALAEQYDEAVAAGREALAMARDYHWEGFAAWSCQALALAYAGNERTTLAARLLGFVDASYEARGVKRRRADAAVYLRLTTLLRERFEDGEFEEAVAIGRTLTVDAACAVAIGEPAPHSAKDGKQVLTNEKVPYGS